MSIQIEFVNHSSFVVHANSIQLLIDPWLAGRVFNNGWDIISSSAFGVEDFKRITHIWFSHEHPDHFHPPSLNLIDPDSRENITVLFQETID